MVAVDHAAQPVRQLFARSSSEYAEVATDRKVPTTASDQDGANASVLGNLGRRFGEIGGHVRVDRIALLRAVETQSRHAVGEIEQHGLQGTAGLAPTRRIGVLFERADAPLV